MGDEGHPAAAAAHRRQVLEAVQRADAVLSANSGDRSTSVDALLDLRRLAFLPGGFRSNDLRKRVWPVLLGYSSEDIAAFYAAHRIKLQQPPFASTSHRDDSQVRLDVNRSMGMSRWTDVASLKRGSKRKALFSLLHATLCISPDAHYFQGFHDVASVFLLTVGMPLAVPLLTRMSTSYMVEPMRTNLDTVLPLFSLLYPLIATQDPSLAKHIAGSVDHAYFALPWILTWFAHQVDALHDVARLYDVLLASHPIFPLYVAATLLLKNRATILAVEPDFADLHSTLQSLGHGIMDDVEGVLEAANDLFHNIPPRDIVETAAASTAAVRQSTYMSYPLPHQRRLGVADDAATHGARRLDLMQYGLVCGVVVGVVAVAAAILPSFRRQHHLQSS
ncbi:hypothetical protein H310_08018 [Aphanomyces invadans]|uniref:Rab-GAP TBC domain-containing protein n=1 Tax=Aphanomyces invadans TaxID=157072 RepID=A0A024TYN9_9STRA|nr:hypothetical protein H310_08018 [Aphanomyces invadans]ETV99280.1 hypothetical protein H310_08018 [Aphanomyces invadans]|eukprot:XP_008871836.1 hypothetical protein H310_08018 [Aphanomyces invadans]